MSKYTCNRCGYITPLKYNFIKHINRKNICPPKLLDVDINCILAYNGLAVSTQMSTQMSTQLSSQCQPCDTINNISSSYTCDNCNMIFKHRQTRSKHMKLHCKLRKKLYNTYKYKYEELKDKMNKLLEKLLMSDDNNITTTSSHNIITNSHNTTNTDNSTDNSQNVNINNYGDEDRSFITKERMKEILSKPFDSLSRLVNETHFNKNHPENHNLRIPNKKQPFIEVYKNNSWALVGQYRFLCKMMDSHRNILYEAYLEVKPELDAKTQQLFIDYRDEVDGDMFTFQSQLRELKAAIIAGTRYK